MERYKDIEHTSCWYAVRLDVCMAAFVLSV